jgi:hypothetical protein
MVTHRAAYAFHTSALLAAITLIITNLCANAQAVGRHDDRVHNGTRSTHHEDYATPDPKTRQDAARSAADRQQSSDTQAQSPESKDDSRRTTVDRQIQLEHERIKQKLIICRHC